MKWTPRPYQLAAMKEMVKNGGMGELLFPGQGKTSITLGAFMTLKRQGFVKRMLVIAPMRVATQVWPEEVAKWDQFKKLKLVVLHGKDKNALLQQPDDIYVINPEGLPWLLPRLKKLKCEMLVVDESTKFKHTNTSRFRLLKGILPLFSRRYILTGTIVPNGYMDLFGQHYIIDGGKALGRYITQYRGRYFTPASGAGHIVYTWALQKGADAAIQAAIRPTTFTVPETEVQLPEIVETAVYVELPPAVRRVYRDMEKEMLAVLEDRETVVARSAAAVSGKCRQVANGGIYLSLWTDEGVKRLKHDGWRDLHTAKVEAVQDLVEQIGKPCLVLYDFHHDRERLLKAFPNAPFIGGGVSPQRAAETVRAWNRGEIPVLLGHPASMGHGLNLQESGGAVIWHSLTWDYDLYDQTTRRIRRSGNPEPRTYVYHILARGTIDEVMLKALRGKERVQTSLIEALRTWGRRK